MDEYINLFVFVIIDLLWDIINLVLYFIFKDI